MKKHIVGLAVFSLIVGSAILVETLFSPASEIVKPATTYNYTYVTKNSCWRKKRQRISESPIPVVRQAFLNRDTKRVDWEIYTPEPETPVALHFFAKSSKGVRYITTEVIPIVGSSQVNTIKYSTTYTNLHNFAPYENLYVIPETISDFDAEAKNFNPKFDETLATPITVFSDK